MTANVFDDLYDLRLYGLSKDFQKQFKRRVRIFLQSLCPELVFAFTTSTQQSGLVLDWLNEGELINSTANFTADFELLIFDGNKHVSSANQFVFPIKVTGNKIALPFYYGMTEKDFFDRIKVWQLSENLRRAINKKNEVTK